MWLALSHGIVDLNYYVRRISIADVHVAGKQTNLRHKYNIQNLHQCHDIYKYRTLQLCVIAWRVPSLRADSDSHVDATQNKSIN